MTLAQFPKNKLFKNHDTVLMKKLWIFFPEMTLAQFPKSDFFIFRWIFFPKMTLAQFPIFGFFFQDSRIGVKGHIKFSKLSQLRPSQDILFRIFSRIIFNAGGVI